MRFHLGLSSATLVCMLPGANVLVVALTFVIKTCHWYQNPSVLLISAVKVHDLIQREDMAAAGIRLVKRICESMHFIEFLSHLMFV